MTQGNQVLNPITPVTLNKGDKAAQQVAALTTFQTQLTPEALTKVVTVKLKAGIREALEAAVAAHDAANSVLSKANAAFNDKEFDIPKDFKDRLKKLVDGLKEFDPQTKADDPTAQAPKPDLRKEYSVSVSVSGKVGTFRVTRSYPVPADFKKLFEAVDEAVKGVNAASKEVQRLNGEKNRLPELAEEIAASLTLVQVGQIEGGDAMVSALEAAGEAIAQKIGVNINPARTLTDGTKKAK